MLSPLLPGQLVNAPTLAMLPSWTLKEGDMAQNLQFTYAGHELHSMRFGGNLLLRHNLACPE